MDGRLEIDDLMCYNSISLASGGRQMQRYGDGADAADII
jgi:hypothetical protein